MASDGQDDGALVPRRWSPGPLAGWIMLNPSTANAKANDPTVRRCIAFARRWGYGGIVIRNLYALRASDPRELDHHPDPSARTTTPTCPAAAAKTSPCSPGAAAAVPGAWPSPNAFAHQEIRLHQLATTAAGHPRHPLYLPADSTPVPIGDHREQVP